ncbi:hypothetical protein LB515_15310 [Mesorhizobium sp. CA15]|uniref:hypothetical protein n=1 Tax=Mesorhizobium sp. CA15 TaxID=2876641 RepID=UPI001CD181E1|nr:hypothetical protein [Mesorhizobium sp. CA15]MBZ9866746.1 hypothetical protein [Mesorhizobium sp. CA15]
MKNVTVRLGGFAAAVRNFVRRRWERFAGGALNRLFTIKSDPVLPADDAPETHPRPGATWGD